MKFSSITRFFSAVIILGLLLPAVAQAQYNPKASQVSTNTANFNGNLSAADNTVQKALETLDEAAGGGGSGDVTDVWTDTGGDVSALTAASGDTFDAGSADSSKPCKRGSALPGTCAEGDCFQDTDSGGIETYVCTATNTWTKAISATDNVATATALASNPTDCSANQFANAIAASGNLTCAAIADGDVPNNITIDLAAAATALASNPTDCSANQFATTIAASGNLTCSAIVDADVPNTITIDLAAAATALASNPTDCSANQFANTIAASGNLTCSAIADADVPNSITIDSCNAVEGTDLGTLTNLRICSYDSSGTEIDCNLTCADITGSADLCDGSDDGAGGGSGDITSVGDVASGAAFDGTQGTTFTFQDPDGDKTIALNQTSNEFTVSSSLNITGSLEATGGVVVNAATETNVEAAVDTLANLTSIQGRTVTLADAAANAFFGWDDVAGAYENLTGAEAEAIMEPLIDTLANLTSIQSLTVTLADAGSADAIFGWDDSQSAYENLTAAEALAVLEASVNILLETEIDASSELRGIMDDESGTGALIFADGAIGAATATTPAENDNDTSVPTTAWVQTEIAGLGGGGGVVLTVCSSTSSYTCDYTADGTDDQDTINQALIDLPDEGGTVLMTEGTFTTSGTITIDSYQTLAGQGYNSTHFFLESGSAPLERVIENADRVNGNTGIVLRDFSYDANRAGQSSYVRGIIFLDVTYAQFQNLFLKGFRNGAGTEAGDAIRLMDGSDFAKGDNIWCEDIGYDCIKPWSSDYGTFTNIHCHNTDAGCVQVVGESVGNTFTNITAKHDDGSPTSPSPFTKCLFVHGSDHGFGSPGSFGNTFSNYLCDGYNVIVGFHGISSRNVWSNGVGFPQAIGSNESAIYMRDASAETNSAVANKIDHLYIRPIDGASDSILRIDDGSQTNNEISNVTFAIGGGTGTWTIDIGSGASGNILKNNVFLSTITVNDSGTGTRYLNNVGGANAGIVAASTDNYNLGDAAGFEAPNAAAPTTNAAGELALDTTITDHQPLWQYYDGGENMTLIAIDTSQLPALDDEIIKYDAATDKFMLEADAGSSVWTDADPTLLGTTTRDVVVGAAQKNTSKLTVDGDADQVQVTIQGHTSQTGTLFVIEDSSGTSLFEVENDGTTTITSTGTAGIAFKDTGGVTADPCGTEPIGFVFWNATSNYLCYCNGAGADIKVVDESTTCF